MAKIWQPGHKMERLLTAEDVADVLQVSKRTAYTYMLQMVHLARPMRVTENSLRTWINEHTAGPKGTDAARSRSKRYQKPGMEDGYHIPRRRIG